MKSYTKVYLDYFGYDVSDFIPCEVCGGKAVDINHLEARSRRKDLLNDINNLMAICRQCHIDLADKKQYKEFLQNIHNQKLKDVQQP